MWNKDKDDPCDDWGSKPLPKWRTHKDAQTSITT